MSLWLMKDLDKKIIMINNIITYSIVSNPWLIMLRCSPIITRIGDVMVSVLASRAVDRGLEPRSGQTKDY